MEGILAAVLQLDLAFGFQSVLNAADVTRLISVGCPQVVNCLNN